jgi:SAM-dependent methyltransferase
MDTEREVASHYSRSGLQHVILQALAAEGKDVEKLTPADLSRGDEFHLGWHPVTVEFGKALGLAPGMRVLDVGSGIGGPARHFAAAHGCSVTGIDLTQDFVDTAIDLTRRCGLADRVDFRQASALAMPFEAASFDAATLIHVGMNIEDKARLFAEVRRVLKPGGIFGVYDIMHMDEAELPYPMPWSAVPETSFVATPDTYRQLLTHAGFRIESERNRRELAIKLGREIRDRAAKEGVPPFGMHLLMGPANPERLGNVTKTLESGTIAPIEMIARAA